MRGAECEEEVGVLGMNAWSRPSRLQAHRRTDDGEDSPSNLCHVVYHQKGDVCVHVAGLDRDHLPNWNVGLKKY